MSPLKTEQLKTGELELDPSCIKVFSGNANPNLSRDIAQIIGHPLGELIITRFADGELRCAIDESIRGADVFIIQPTCKPVNDTLMELLILCDAFKRASARRIVPIIPTATRARTKKCARASRSPPNSSPT